MKVRVSSPSVISSFQQVLLLPIPISLYNSTDFTPYKKVSRMQPTLISTYSHSRLTVIQGLRIESGLCKDVLAQVKQICSGGTPGVLQPNEHDRISIGRSQFLDSYYLQSAQPSLWFRKSCKEMIIMKFILIRLYSSQHAFDKLQGC